MSRIVDVEPLDCLAWQDGEHGTTFDDGVRWVLSKIDEQPTIEERKTGKWIIDDHDEYAVCDRCGEPCASYVMGKPRDNFCKWCGADMRGDNDEPL